MTIKKPPPSMEQIKALTKDMSEVLEKHNIETGVSLVIIDGHELFFPFAKSIGDLSEILATCKHAIPSKADSVMDQLQDYLSDTHLPNQTKH